MKLASAVLLLVATISMATFFVTGSSDGPAGLQPSPTGTASDEPSPVLSPSAQASAGLRFAVVGDAGTGASVQQDVADRMCRYRRRHPFRLVITTGDNVYPDGHPERFDEAFYRPFACLLDQGVRFRSSLGNHDIMTDGGRSQIDEPGFGYRGRNYVVRRGGVRFVMADSNNMNRQWLDRALAARDGDRWTIVAFHHPVYSPGEGHGSTAGFSDLPDLFRKHGVDLVLSGHDHLYAVTRKLRRIRYIVTGGGGAPLYGCGEAWFSARCESRHHFLWIRATEEKIVVKAVPVVGPPFDRVKTFGREGEQD